MPTPGGFSGLAAFNAVRVAEMGRGDTVCVYVCMCVCGVKRCEARRRDEKTPTNHTKHTSEQTDTPAHQQPNETNKARTPNEGQRHHRRRLVIWQRLGSYCAQEEEEEATATATATTATTTTATTLPTTHTNDCIPSLAIGTKRLDSCSLSRVSWVRGPNCKEHTYVARDNREGKRPSE
jgi:hypothetical protein